MKQSEIIEKLQKEFPGHSFSIDMYNELLIDNQKALRQWSHPTDAWFEANRCEGTVASELISQVKKEIQRRNR